MTVLKKRDEKKEKTCMIVSSETVKKKNLNDCDNLDLLVTD
jgi:hypothetical protein